MILEDAANSVDEGNIFQKVNEVNGQCNEGENLAVVPNQNDPPLCSLIYVQPTQKRIARSKGKKNGAGDAGSKVYAKKRHMHAEVGEKNLKRLKVVQLNDNIGMDSSMAEVGIDQPRHIL